MARQVIPQPTSPVRTSTDVSSNDGVGKTPTYAFERDDVPLPTTRDTILEILSDGKPKADHEILAQSQQMGRSITLKRIKAQRAKLVRDGVLIPAAGYAFAPKTNARTAHRYTLNPE